MHLCKFTAMPVQYIAVLLYIVSLVMILLYHVSYYSNANIVSCQLL